VERGERIRERARSAGERGRALKRSVARLDVPWARWGLARGTREVFLTGILGPVMGSYIRRRVHGLEHFEELRAPVVFVANHSSHMDTPVILRSLPRRWRQRTAVAAAADYFYRNRLVAAGVSWAFATVPMARSGGGLSEDAAGHVDRLLDQRWNLLMYPEGTRSRNGRMGRLRSGAVVLAADHGMGIMPIAVQGTYDAMPPGRSWPKRLWRGLRPVRYPVEVHFGPPVYPAEHATRASVKHALQGFFAERAIAAGPGPALPRAATLPPAALADTESERTSALVR
jgi:1-acyl-sn-glycerol-3-phosphate acyltransferase